MREVVYKMNWNRKEKAFFSKAKTPYHVQELLDSLDYNTDDLTRSVRYAIQVNKAHCLDGALIAAAALEYLGFPPLILDLRANESDDDHVIVPFQVRGCWGAVGKSNFSGLRYREPVYQNLRELVMSYFEPYFNLEGERTLREYSLPLNLSKISQVDWRFGLGSMDEIGVILDGIRHFSLLSKSSIKALTLVDKRSIAAGKVGLNIKGAFRKG